MKFVTLKIDGRVIALQVAVYASYHRRLMGLMGRRCVPYDGVLLCPCGSIHTCFMRIDIDVIFLSASGQILGLREGVHPGRFCFAPTNVRMALEMPAGFISEERLTVSDRLVWSAVA